MASASGSAPLRSTLATDRACDSCRSRKVKCVGSVWEQCQACAAKGQPCEYLNPPLKKGPKGGRTGGATGRSQARQVLQTRTPSLAPLSKLDECMQVYSQQMHPILPVLHPSIINELRENQGRTDDAYVLICSICAIMYLMPGTDITNVNLGTTMCEEAVRMSKNYNVVEKLDKSSLTHLYSCLFLAMAYGYLKSRQDNQHHEEWYYLRLATSLAIIMGLDEDSPFQQNNHIRQLSLTVYWTLFIKEREYAMGSPRPVPLSLGPISLPDLDGPEVNDRQAALRFNFIIKFFTPYDTKHIKIWRTVPALEQQALRNPGWLQVLQGHLRHCMASYLGREMDSVLEEIICRQWLMTMIWQMVTAHNFVTTQTRDLSLAFWSIEPSLSMELEQLHDSVMDIGRLKQIALLLRDISSLLPIDPQYKQLGLENYFPQLLDTITRNLLGQRPFLQPIGTAHAPLQQHPYSMASIPAGSIPPSVYNSRSDSMSHVSIGSSGHQLYQPNPHIAMQAGDLMQAEPGYGHQYPGVGPPDAMDPSNYGM